MRLSTGWLAEWIDLPEDVDVLADRLTMAGIEIEGIERAGSDLSAIRVGHVLERNPHPNADRLSVCSVDLGGDAPVEIVCGAPNVAAGQKVAVAVPGTVLPDGTKLKKSKIRGVASQGMICSSEELGVPGDAAGILLLPEAAPPGACAGDWIDTGDTILDVAITPNRGDWVSVLGIAREVRAAYGGDLRWPDCAPEEKGAPTADAIRVAIDDAEGCHRYVARIIRGVRVAPSPDWVQKKLEAIGVRPINNVVDLTNLVLAEMGQPLHAFDLAKISGAEIRVRPARVGESIETLDGVERPLEATDLVIADAQRAIAIAGVMGGSNSEVSDASVDLLIESAQFHPSRVRKTARRLGLQTEASYRFERGVDPEGVARAADRVSRLIAEIAGGTVAPAPISIDGSAPQTAESISLSTARTNRLLGTDLATPQVAQLLQRIDVECEPADADHLVCRPPSYRNDLFIPQDLIEEVARIYGYDEIPTTLPAAQLQVGLRPLRRVLADGARDALRDSGLVEVMSFSAIPPGDLDALGLSSEDPRRNAVRLLNPIAEEASILRTTLLPSLLRGVQRNLNYQVDPVRMFEVSRVFHARPGELPEERNWAAAALTRGESRLLWGGTDPAPLFFEGKGIAERLLSALGYAAEFRSPCGEPFLHPGASSAIAVSGQSVGAMGELHPECAARFGIEAPCVVIVVDLTALEALPAREIRYREVSRHPAVRRDLAVLLDRSVAAGEVVEAIRKTAGNNLTSMDLFDRYEGKGVPDGKVSLALRLTFQRIDRTLTEPEVAKAADRVIKMLAERFGGQLR